MATIAIPLGIQLAVELLPKIPDIVKYVEQLFGPKTGPTKLKVATALTAVVSDALATAGKISGNPTTVEIAAMVQGIVSGMNAKGELGKPATIASNIVTGASSSIEGTYTITLKKVG